MDKIILTIILLLFLGCNTKNEKLSNLCINEAKPKLDYQKKYRIPYFDDYRDGLDCARNQSKPVLIIFSVLDNHQQMYSEFEQVFIKDREIRKMIKDEYFNIFLYTDDNRELREEQKEGLKDLNFRQKLIEEIKIRNTQGKLNSTIQQEILNSNASPFYVMLDPKGNPLLKPFAYLAKNPDAFKSKLKQGIEIMKN